LLAQPLECRHDLSKHELRGQIAVVALARDVVVQLKQINPLELQALQARLQRCRDRRSDPAAFARRNAHLGADQDVGFEALDDAPEIAFGFTIAVHRCGVEIIDAELDRPLYRTLLVGRVAAHHQTADGAAPEPENRYFEPRAPECACFHRVLRRSWSRSNASRPGLSIVPGVLEGGGIAADSSSVRDRMTRCSRGLGRKAGSFQRVAQAGAVAGGRNATWPRRRVE
jgi:hypothetical protein